MKNYFSFYIFTAVILLTAGISKAQMSWNQACTFGGNSTSYISVANSASINFTDSFTLEAWVNPSTLSGLSKGIFAKGGTLGTTLRYGLRLSTNGSFSFITNGVVKLNSRLSNAVKINEWSHVSATYNNSTNVFCIYINGELDTSSVIASPPSSNGDSLFLGISGSSTPFKGQLDEIRMWNRELSASEVSKYMRLSLGNSGGIYSGLVLSMTFQKTNNISPFTAEDISGNQNNGSPRNVSASDQSYRPYHTIIPNESIQCFSNGDYIAAKDALQVFPSGDFTFECWFYLTVADNVFKTIFLKPSSTGTGFSLSVNSNSIKVMINDQPRIVHPLNPINQWHHVTIVFNSQTGAIEIYKNGSTLFKFSSTETGIAPTADSMYIGGGNATQSFIGFIDEVRITGRKLTGDEIKKRVYRSLNKSDDSEPSVTNICYNLDGNTFDNGDNGGPEFFLRNNACFSHLGQNNLVPRAPAMSMPSDEFYNSFYFTTANLKIPSTGTQGIISSGISANLDYGISDADVFVLLDHSNLRDIRISLIAADGDSLVIFDGDSANSSDNNLTLLFNDEADSSLKDKTYSSFCSEIKPINNINAFLSSKRTKGNWSLRVQDKFSLNTGMLYAWGIRFNNMSLPESNLNMRFTIQGFYNPATQIMPVDTVTVNLRSFSSPFNLISASKTTFAFSGLTLLSFSGTNESTPYYLQVIHRNSIETWSSGSVIFRTGITTDYYFSTSDTTALGNNLIQVSTFPVKYAIYSGDQNQDGIVELSDVVNVYNDAISFSTGYISSDMNGDNTADLSDIVITYNNSIEFVQRVIP